MVNELGYPEGDGDTNNSYSAGDHPQGLGKENGRSGNHRKNRDHTDHSIVEIS